MSIERPFVLLGLRVTTALASIANLAGCSASPSRGILGSYFPTWMVCALLGAVGVIPLRLVFVRFGIDATLPVPAIVYLSLWLSLTLAIWLLWLA